MAPRPLELYHARTRRRGVNRFVYWPARYTVEASPEQWLESVRPAKTSRRRTHAA